MPQAEKKVRWGAEEYTSPPSYLGSRQPRRFNVSDARLTPLIKKGNEEFGSWRKAGDACKSMAIVAGTNGVSEAVNVGFQLIGVLGIGKVATAGIAAVRGVSTGLDIESFGKTFQENKNRCICGRCTEIYDYVFDQLQLKAAKQYVGVIPGISTLSVLGFALHGAYKHAVGTAGVERHKNACKLWVCAKDGCPCAKALISQLFDWDLSAFVTVMTSYAGIEAVARKMKSK